MGTTERTAKGSGARRAPPAIVVHHLRHARAALAAAERAGIAVRLESAANAAAQGGVSWFKAVIAAAREAHPAARFEAVLDCGAAAGRALGAIREGMPAIRTQAAPRARAKIIAMSRAAGIKVYEGTRGPALDLCDAPDPETAVRDYLSGDQRERRRPQNGRRAARPRRLQKA